MKPVKVMAILEELPPLRLVVALPAEARPIAQALELTRFSGRGGYRIWESRQVWMVQSGVGREKAAAATRSLLELSPKAPDALWLNVGICGHGCRRVGELVAARWVLEADTGKSWTMAVPDALTLPVVDLQTVDSPEGSYPEECGYDMEASGFVSAARSFSENERIFVLKVVSDNKDTPARGLTARKVESLVAESLPGWLLAIRDVTG